MRANRKSGYAAPTRLTSPTGLLLIDSQDGIQRALFSWQRVLSPARWRYRSAAGFPQVARR